MSYIYLLCIYFCETEVCPILLVALSEEFLEFRIFRLDSNHFSTWSFYKPCSKEIRHNILVPVPMQCYKNTFRSDTVVILILALIISSLLKLCPENLDSNFGNFLRKYNIKDPS